MEYSLSEIFYNQPVIAVLASWFLAQFLKVVTNLIKEKKLDFKWFVSIGGFPSSHSAAVAALATSLGLKYGFSSGFFAIALVLAGLIILDARVIRQAAGKQAEILNQIVEDLYKKRGLKFERLREFLGHTSLEVFVGIVLGIIIGILVTY